MKKFPYTITSNEPTQKEVWLDSFNAALHRMPAEEAITEADKALELCNKRWERPPCTETWNYSHNYPVGRVFKDVTER